MQLAQVKNSMSSPLFASLFRQRREALIITGAASAQFILTALEMPGWSCPFKAVLGIPCPGCGLSTATGLLLHGNWSEAIHTHAFAPVFLIALLLGLILVLLPGKYYQPAVSKVAIFEQRTGITSVLLIALLAYWGLRLLHLV
jgi:hypothetical protein